MMSRIAELRKKDEKLQRKEEERLRIKEQQERREEILPRGARRVNINGEILTLVKGEYSDSASDTKEEFWAKRRRPGHEEDKQQCLLCGRIADPEEIMDGRCAEG